jgi:hypothetical protein
MRQFPTADICVPPTCQRLGPTRLATALTRRSPRAKVIETLRIFAGAGR